MPLADVTAISFTAPFIVAGLAGPRLHERVGTGQWLTIAVGFLGALVIIRPGFGHTSPYALLWGSASNLSPFHYSQLILAALAGYLAFGDVPIVWTWAGAAIIIGSGLHIVWRETSR